MPTGLVQVVERYTARGVRVAIEAGNQTAWIVDLLRELGAKVRVVHPLKVKLIAESKKKTDRMTRGGSGLLAWCDTGLQLGWPSVPGRQTDSQFRRPQSRRAASLMPPHSSAVVSRNSKPPKWLLVRNALPGGAMHVEASES